jgi:biotin carboxyl carrier protein
MAELSRPTDPGAVRVRLESASRLADEPAIEVSPAPEPLRMTNPTVGTGPLGGHAMTPPEVAAGPAVLAQRQVLVDGGACDATLRPLAAGRHVLEEGTSGSRVILEPYAASGGLRSREVLVDGFRFVVEVEPARVAALRERATSARGAAAHAGPLQVKAIIPGKVVAVSVKVGDAVTAGQQLLVVEAMKMQNELRAPRDGTIERVSVAAGVSIEIGDLLVVIS